MLLNTVDEAVSNLFPGYFALVMATGIVSIAAHLLGMEWIIPRYFIYFALAAWVVTFARLAKRLFSSPLTHAG